MGIITGCRHTSELFREDAVDEAGNIDYSVIYYIHADSDDLYHDTKGKPVHGNIEVLNDALHLAGESKSGEQSRNLFDSISQFHG
jgi:hypothetical protein